MPEEIIWKHRLVVRKTALPELWEERERGCWRAQWSTGGWLATVSYPRTFENTFVRKYESTSFVRVQYESTFVRVLSKVLSYFRTFVRISIKVVIQLQYVVLSYLRSILFLSSYGSTKVRKYNYSRKYHTSVRVLHSVHFAGFTVSRGYGGHTTVRCTRTCTVQ
jgi:hypothetical protein